MLNKKAPIKIEAGTLKNEKTTVILNLYRYKTTNVVF